MTWSTPLRKQQLGRACSRTATPSSPSILCMIEQRFPVVAQPTQYTAASRRDNRIQQLNLPHTNLFGSETETQTEIISEVTKSSYKKKNIRFNEACSINEVEIPIEVDSLQQPTHKKLDGETFYLSHLISGQGIFTPVPGRCRRSQWSG